MLFHFSISLFAQYSGGIGRGDILNGCLNPSNGGIIGSNHSGCSPYKPPSLIGIVAPTGYAGTVEYCWQQSTTGSSQGFTDIPNSNNADYNPDTLFATTWFRRLVRVACKDDWSNSTLSNLVQITVNTSPEAPTGDSLQAFAYIATISNLVAIGNSIHWYDAANGGNLLLNSDTIHNGITYYASQTLGSCESNKRLAVRVELTYFKTVKLHLFLEGLFDNSSNNMIEAQDVDLGTGLASPKYGQGIADRISVDFFEEVSPFSPAGLSISGVDLLTNGEASFQMSTNLSGNYFIRVRSRNHLEAWSAIAVPFGSGFIDYDFTSNAYNAFQAPGGNDPQAMLSNGTYAFYLGDLDQNLGVDFDDYNLFEPFLNEGTYGFTIADFNGNALVDFDDYNIFEPRLNEGDFAQYPGMP